MRNRTGLVALALLSVFSVLALVAFAVEERLEVYEVNCEKARKKFHQEARRRCIHEGMQLQNAYPKKCEPAENVEQDETSIYKVVQYGKVVCTIRQ